MVLDMKRWEGKVAVVSGVGGGIGSAVAEALVNHGVVVGGLVHTPAKAQPLLDRLKNAKGQLHLIKTDLKDEADILQAFNWVKQNLGPIHILVNCAGCGRKTTLVDGDATIWKEVFDVNVLGLCVSTREAIRDMRKNGIDGHIVHISSIRAHTITPRPFTNVYPASKHAVKALTETLRQELNSIGSKIKISSVSPGVVETNFNLSANMCTKDDLNSEQRKAQPKLICEDVADATIYILSTPPHVQVHDLIVKPVGEAF